MQGKTMTAAGIAALLGKVVQALHESCWTSVHLQVAGPALAATDLAEYVLGPVASGSGYAACYLDHGA